LNHRHRELLQNKEELKQRLAESTEREQDNAAWIQELTEEKDRLERELIESSGHLEQRLVRAVRREKEIDDSQPAMVESKNELQHRLQEMDQFPQEHLQIIRKYRNSRKLLNVQNQTQLYQYCT